MKLVKTANGKKQIKISKSEWKSIGKKAGWMKKAELLMLNNDDVPTDEEGKKDYQRKNKTAAEVQSMLPKGLFAKEINDVKEVVELSRGTNWCTREERMARYYIPFVAVFNKAGELMGAYEPGAGKVIGKNNNFDTFEDALKKHLK